ncbi:hypothetical protein UFOVP273_102 [uncultured Caudovirales phage]|uniref:Uncharacterized protein n=1 Tax=uncultured Caudovirales phage TaxID=2100421 RepID=A0A6J5LMA8_9CAUD|nr:hypothetical protein UFOVP273_102 [uncultured Caudovirales phage]
MLNYDQLIADLFNTYMRSYPSAFFDKSQLDAAIRAVSTAADELIKQLNLNTNLRDPIV